MAALDRLEGHMREVEASLAARAEAQDRIDARVAALEGRIERFAAHFDDESGRVLRALQAIRDDEPNNRRRLTGVRSTSTYETAYSEAEPLVSVLIPTYKNVDALITRSLPSVLSQTYKHLEVVVVGDGAPELVGEALAQVDDPRVRYLNLPLRGPYPPHPRSWYVKGVPPLNAAFREARGLWIAPFADDDALRPDAIESVLAEARRRRLELCYGVQRGHLEDGSEVDIGEFPPSLGRVGLQGSLFHASLVFLEQELSDEAFGLPSDWSLLHRMMRIGVRVGFLDQIVCDYYRTPVPSALLT